MTCTLPPLNSSSLLPNDTSLMEYGLCLDL
jgi:hypothetical protein